MVFKMILKLIKRSMYITLGVISFYVFKPVKAIFHIKTQQLKNCSLLELLFSTERFKVENWQKCDYQFIPKERPMIEPLVGSGLGNINKCW